MIIKWRNARNAVHSSSSDESHVIPSEKKKDDDDDVQVNSVVRLGWKPDGLFSIYLKNNLKIDWCAVNV